MNKIKTTKQIGQSGTSLTINITLECLALNLKRGDWVAVTIENLNVDEEYKHPNNDQ